MTDDSTGRFEAAAPSREIGRAGDSGCGPKMVILGGIHGNEPSGVQAARRVLARIERDRVELDGEVIFLAGNLTALRGQARFIDLDLNRQWIPDRIARLRENGEDRAVEDHEQRDLLEALAAAVADAPGDVYFLDLHTSSADGSPFVTVGDTLRNRRFAAQLPLPLILGLEEQVDGALLEYLNNFGFVTMGVEGGQHDDAAAIDHHEAAIWLSLVSAGIVKPGRIADVDRFRELLLQASRGVPRVVEVRRRHGLSPGDAFRMEPGFCNFDPVERGQLLARDNGDAIHSPESGLLLLPLYQGQGDDGFFISREVLPFWLRVSSFVRRLHLTRLFPLLPGVRRLPGTDEVLIVDTHVARWFPLEIFHLFGFRKLRTTGDKLLVSRRRYDLAPPARISLP
jgi:succinylglutamate desuccinylase